jgi:hypothetical protein
MSLVSICKRLHSELGLQDPVLGEGDRQNRYRINLKKFFVAWTSFSQLINMVDDTLVSE